MKGLECSHDAVKPDFKACTNFGTEIQADFKVFCSRYKNIDLTYILFDNESNKSTGGQNSYQNHLNYIDIAKSSGFEVIEKTIKELSQFSQVLQKSKNKSGLKFIHVKCGLDEETPRPPLEIVKVSTFNEK